MLFFTIKFAQNSYIIMISNGYTIGCPPVPGDDRRAFGDNPRDLASGLSIIQVDNHGIAILYHLHKYRPCKSL